MPALLQSRNKILNPERYMAETFPVNCLSMKGTRMKIYQKDMLIYYAYLLYAYYIYYMLIYDMCNYLLLRNPRGFSLYSP